MRPQYVEFGATLLAGAYPINGCFGSLPDAQYTTWPAAGVGVYRPLTGYQASVCLRPEAAADGAIELATIFHARNYAQSSSDRGKN
jgi:hypothetical protein